MRITSPWTSAVLAYWFEGIDDAVALDFEHPTVRRWHSKAAEIDLEIWRRFGSVHQDLTHRLEHGWSPPSWPERVAAIVTLDQFPRNMFRGTPKMYATDAQALSLCHGAFADGEHLHLPLAHRLFLYMPLMHSEIAGDQELSVSLFERLRNDALTLDERHAGFFSMVLNYAVRHAAIVARFGRFPHRNPFLDRTSTSEEDAFLQEPGSSF